MNKSSRTPKLPRKKMPKRLTGHGLARSQGSTTLKTKRWLPWILSPGNRRWPTCLFLKDTKYRKQPRSLIIIVWRAFSAMELTAPLVLVIATEKTIRPSLSSARLCKSANFTKGPRKFAEIPPTAPVLT